MTTAPATRLLSGAGRARMLAVAGEPLFFARWDQTVFIHYEAEPALLQRQIPFPLDLHEGRAFVSIVAFTMLRMRPRLGGQLGEWLFRPIASHGFLNLRTYVRESGEPGIFFLAEWLANPLSVWLGPRTFGLPYRSGKLNYEHSDTIHGEVTASEGRLEYAAPAPAATLAPSHSESRDEFLLERYTAFTIRGRRPRLFRVWHEPWLQTPVEIDVRADDLIAATGAWWQSARPIGANYSPGVEVWMGRPNKVRLSPLKSRIARAFETKTPPAATARGIPRAG